jgi:hypothetical protein
MSRFRCSFVQWSADQATDDARKCNRISGDAAALDRAVWAAYGWDDDPATTTDEAILARLLALNGERAAT